MNFEEFKEQIVKDMDKTRNLSELMLILETNKMNIIMIGLDPKAFGEILKRNFKK